jgi:hypothetical protein
MFSQQHGESIFSQGSIPPECSQLIPQDDGKAIGFELTGLALPHPVAYALEMSQLGCYPVVVPVDASHIAS